MARPHAIGVAQPWIQQVVDSTPAASRSPFEILGGPV